MDCTSLHQKGGLRQKGDMMDKKLLDELMMDVKPEDLDEKNRAIFEIIGIEAMKKLFDLRRGDNLYIPKPEKLIMQARNRRIIKEYREGTTISCIAKKYDLTAQHVWRIVKEEPIKGQISIEDYMKSADR